VSLAHADRAEDLYKRVVELHAERIIQEAPVPKAEEIRRSLAGQTPTATRRVEGVDAVQGYGLHVFDVPIQQVWMAINDTPHQRGFTAVDRTETIAGTPRQSGRVSYQLLEIPMIPDRWWVVRTANNGALYDRTRGEVWEMGWVDATSDAATLAGVSTELQSLGVPVGFARGSWFLVDLGGTTWAEYYVWTDPGGNLPIAATNKFAESQVARAINGVEVMARQHIPTCTAAFFEPNGNPLPGRVVER
jgi:hypothetical protein